MTPRVRSAPTFDCTLKYARLMSPAVALLECRRRAVQSMTEDGKPIIDRHPAIEGCFVFTGDSGSSFKTAPAIGRIFAEWIADGCVKCV